MIFQLREWCRRLWETFRRRDSEAEEELRFHLEMAELEALGRGEDVRQARLRAGGIALAAEAVPDQGTIRWLGDFLRDGRYGIRLLRRSRAARPSPVETLRCERCAGMPSIPQSLVAETIQATDAGFPGRPSEH